MKLYEIALEYMNFLEEVENGNIPLEAINDTLEGIEGTLKDKIDNVACVIKNLSADADAIKAEEQKLAKRRKTKENQIEWLKKYLSDIILKTGQTKIETPRNKISFRSSESVKINDETEFIQWAMMNHDEYLTFKKPDINKAKIKKVLASGDTIPGAYLENKQNIQIK